MVVEEPDIEIGAGVSSKGTYKPKRPGTFLLLCFAIRLTETTKQPSADAWQPTRAASVAPSRADIAMSASAATNAGAAAVAEEEQEEVVVMIATIAVMAVVAVTMTATETETLPLGPTPML